MSSEDLTSLLDWDREPANPPAQRWLIIVAVLGVIAAAIVAFTILTSIVDSREAERLSGVEDRQSVIARSRAVVLQEWLTGRVNLAAHIINADTFRLYASEATLTGGAVSATDLSAQTDYMRTYVLSDFVQQNNAQSGLIGAYLIGPGGRVLIENAQAPPIGPAMIAGAAPVFADGDVRIAPLRADGDRLLLDIYQPVLAVQVEDPGAAPAVAVFLTTADVTAALARRLTDALRAAGEDAYLVQYADGAPAGLVRVDGTAELARLELGDLPPDLAAPDGEPLAFAQRPSVAGNGAVYSVGVRLVGPPDPDWQVVQEIAAGVVTAPIAEARRVANLITIIITAGILLAFAAIILAIRASHRKRLAVAARQSAERINSQRALLYSITSSAREWIGLKRNDGTYEYANPAFAMAVGRAAEQIHGMDDAALFGFRTSQRLSDTDEAALSTGFSMVPEERVFIGDREHYLEVSKAAVNDDAGRPKGLVVVARDVTELVEERRARERGLRQTIQAMVTTVEKADPYLGGHTTLVRVTSLGTGRELGLERNEIRTLEIAANLAQIGKLYVPREILTKPGRLTPAEEAEMRRHIPHAMDVLSGIDFGLPVAETIEQMYERLDGQGYPNGLGGSDISVLARILGLCDVFSARIRPRSYRQALSIDETMDILKANTDRYDEDVIAALGRYVESDQGLLALAQDLSEVSPATPG